jgi:hypothetical protein
VYEHGLTRQIRVGNYDAKYDTRQAPGSEPGQEQFGFQFLSKTRQGDYIGQHTNKKAMKMIGPVMVLRSILPATTLNMKAKAAKIAKFSYIYPSLSKHQNSTCSARINFAPVGGLYMEHN